MAKKDFKKEEQNLENVQEALNTTSVWIEANQNKLTWAITAIVVVVLGVIALNTYVLKPKAAEASNENAKAVVYFAQGNYEVALNGNDAECIGFEAIANEYKCSQPGKLAALYAGICYYQLGDYAAAAEYLAKFSAKDLNIEPAAAQLLGDAYVQMEDYAKAAKAFNAAAKSGNELIAPMSLKKLGFVQMELGNNAAAKKAFETIKNDYPASAEAQDIEKYIAIVK
ncbi:MAG: tetratricopeptide repeat protein [Bacteroidales bacterium]|nr:tetratricopeptide repeat protein [Bacteroidales bacterium]MBP3576070.1 tetratricopeptide repeat protein [Paludibacteraceae bacterium]